MRALGEKREVGIAAMMRNTAVRNWARPDARSVFAEAHIWVILYGTQYPELGMEI